MMGFWEDQKAAAQRESDRAMGEIAERIQGKPVEQAWGALSRRWRDTIDENGQNRRLAFCGHLRQAPQQPMFVAAHRLDLVLCESCATELAEAEYTPELDNTCDACGTYHPEGIYPVVHQMGAMILTAGMCETCRCLDHLTGTSGK